MKRFTTQFASRSSINRITLVTDHFHRYASSLYETVTSPSSASSRRSIRAMGRLNWTDSQSGSWSSSTGTRIIFGDEVGMCCRFRVKCLPLLQNKILRQEDLPSACKGLAVFYICEFQRRSNSAPVQNRRPFARFRLARRIPLSVHLAMQLLDTSRTSAASRSSYVAFGSTCGCDLIIFFVYL